MQSSVACRVSIGGRERLNTCAGIDFCEACHKHIIIKEIPTSFAQRITLARLRHHNAVPKLHRR